MTIDTHLVSGSSLPMLARALRVHQWSKNLLVFIPILASHRFTETALLLNGVAAFATFCLCASSVYLLNDIIDVDDDRRHPTKRFRPIAAGLLSIGAARVLAAALLIVSLALAYWWLPLEYLVALSVYYAVTLAYSLWIKRVVMLDVITLAMLYTIRVIAGALATLQTPTFWLLAFCVFIFLSLAFLKRYTELRLGGAADVAQAQGLDYGRGYLPGDFELLASLGCAAGYISVLVLALYINDSSSAEIYRSQTWLWPACLLLLAWLSRAWLIAHRGEMPDDPIVFALRDNPSRLIGVAVVVVFVLASL